MPVLKMTAGFGDTQVISDLNNSCFGGTMGSPDWSGLSGPWEAGSNKLSEFLEL